MFYLPYPGYHNQQETAFTEKDIEISFTKFVKAKDTRLKKSLNLKRSANNAEFSFYYQTFVKERHIALNVDSNYFEFLTTKQLDEKAILSFIEASLHHDSHTAKLIQIEIKKMVDYEISQRPNNEYLNNWVKKIMFFINKSIEKMHHEHKS